MTYGRVVHTEKGTSGTTYRVRAILAEPGYLAITIGVGDKAEEVERITERGLADVSTYIDMADEEMRCLMADARVEFGR